MGRLRARLAVLSILAVAASIAVAPAASGIPRTGASDAAARSALRHLATDEETYLNDYLKYGSFAQLARDSRVATFHLATGISLTIVHIQRAHGYCLSATTATRQFMYDNYAGMYAGSHCRKITTGRSGGTITGPASVPAAPSVGANSPVQTDLRHLAALEESYYYDHNRYATFDELRADPNGGVMQIHRGVTLTIVHIASLSYCLHGTSGRQTYMYDSAVAQHLYPGSSCRQTTSGPSGGTRSGPYDV